MWEGFAKKNSSNYDAGILAAGKALARRTSARICNERATTPAVKRTSRNAQLVFSRCRSPDFKQALLERLHGENQMNQDPWAKLWYDPFDYLNTPARTTTIRTIVFDGIARGHI